MASALKSIKIIIFLLAAIIFLSQSFGVFNLLPVGEALAFIGQSTNPLIIYLSVFVAGAALFLVPALVEKSPLDEDSKDFLYNNTVRSFEASFFSMFLSVWLAFFTFGIFFGGKTSRLEDMSSAFFLNYYLFWYFLVALALSFVKFASLNRKKQAEFNKSMGEFRKEINEGKTSIPELIKKQQDFAKNRSDK